MEDAKYYTWKDLEEMDADRLRMEVMRLQQYMIYVRGDAGTILDWVDRSIGLNADIDETPSENTIRKVILKECDLKRFETYQEVQDEYGIDHRLFNRVLDDMIGEGIIDGQKSKE